MIEETTHKAVTVWFTTAHLIPKAIRWFPKDLISWFYKGYYVEIYNLANMIRKYFIIRQFLIAFCEKSRLAKYLNIKIKNCN